MLLTISFFPLLILNRNCTPCIGSFNFSVYSHRPEITKFKYVPAIHDKGVNETHGCPLVPFSARDVTQLGFVPILHFPVPRSTF